MGDSGKKRNVLIIARHFPPVNNIAARRFGWMTRYFCDFGWEPFVVTTHGEGPLEHDIPEEKIFRIGKNPQGQVKVEKPEDLSIFKKNPMLAKITIPDRYRFGTIDNTIFTWYPELKAAMSDLLEKLPPIDMIVASYDPAAALFFARKISLETGVPWIADYRDLAGIRRYNKTRFTYRMDLWLEKRLLKSSSGITAVSSSYSRVYGKTYGKPSQTVYNGFFEENQGTEKNDVFSGNISRGKYLYHAGRLYDQRVDSVKLLIDTLPGFEDIHFRFRSLGPLHLEEEIKKYSSEKGLETRVDILPPANPEVVAQEQGRAYANIVFEDLSKEKPLGEGFLTGKFLQLLPGSVPILSICRPDNEMADILQKTERGKVCSTKGEVKEFLHKIALYNGVYRGNREMVKEYGHQKQAGILCGFMDSILESASEKRKK